MGICELDRWVQRAGGPNRQIGINLGKFWRQLKNTWWNVSALLAVCLCGWMVWFHPHSRLSTGSVVVLYHSSIYICVYAITHLRDKNLSSADNLLGLFTSHTGMLSLLHNYHPLHYWTPKPVIVPRIDVVWIEMKWKSLPVQSPPTIGSQTEIVADQWFLRLAQF